jgi:hypothetical protein
MIGGGWHGLHAVGPLIIRLWPRVALGVFVALVVSIMLARRNQETPATHQRPLMRASVN